MHKILQKKHKIFKLLLTNKKKQVKIKLVLAQRAHGLKSGSLAQVVEHLTFNQVVRGSSPRWLTRLGFKLKLKSQKDFKRPRGQAVKTSPFHGGDMGSIPVGVTNKYATLAQLVEQLTCGIDKVYYFILNYLAPLYGNI